MSWADAALLTTEGWTAIYWLRNDGAVFMVNGMDGPILLSRTIPEGQDAISQP